MQTTKQDWLNDALAAAGYFVSGHESTRAFTGVRGKAEVRFARLPGGATVFFLTIGSPEPGYRELYPAAFRAGPLGWLRSVFQPLLQVFYWPDEPDFDVFFPAQGRFKRLSFAELAAVVGAHDGQFTANPGTGKAINASLNDVFQAWTRAHLSARCVVNDLDAFTFALPQAVFLELKRVRESIATWLPYVDDGRNFAALDAIARARGGVAITLAYPREEAAHVAMHRYVVADGRRSVRGKRRAVPVAEAIAQPLLADFSGVETYLSTNRRQP